MFFMRVLVVGCGNIGSVAAEDLARNAGSSQVVLVDNNAAKAKAVADRIGTKNVSWIQLDISNYKGLMHALKDFNLIMGFLPGKLGYCLAEACIDAKKNLVDVSYMAENPLVLNNKAKKAGVTIVPDCGLAPGISNVLVGHSIEQIPKVNAVHIMVGGLPEKPVPPLGYTVTWSPESLIDEYTRKAGIIQEGKKTEVEALSGLEEIDFPNVGRLEAFYTDGLRTLTQTVNDVDDMWEKTLRYPGHAEKIKALKALGLFDEKQVNIEGTLVSPRQLTVKLLGQRLWKPEVKDIVAMKVEVYGAKGNKQIGRVYHLLDSYDEKKGITAMARTTAYPASIVGQLMLKDAVEEKGVLPPETIGRHPELYKSFVEELEKRGVRITEQKTTG